MEFEKLGVWCFTDTLTPAQMIELAQPTENWATEYCGM